MTHADISGHHGSARDAERRITILEQIQPQLVRRIEMLERKEDEATKEDLNRDRVLAQTVIKIQRLIRDVEGLTANQQRFLIGFVACVGGLVISIVRTKVGL